MNTGNLDKLNRTPLPTLSLPFFQELSEWNLTRWNEERSTKLEEEIRKWRQPLVAYPSISYIFRCNCVTEPTMEWHRRTSASAESKLQKGEFELSHYPSPPPEIVTNCLQDTQNQDSPTLRASDTHEAHTRSHEYPSLHFSIQRHDPECIRYNDSIPTIEQRVQNVLRGMHPYPPPGDPGSLNVSLDRCELRDALENFRDRTDISPTQKVARKTATAEEITEETVREAEMAATLSRLNNAPPTNQTELEIFWLVFGDYIDAYEARWSRPYRKKTFDTLRGRLDMLFADSFMDFKTKETMSQHILDLSEEDNGRKLTMHYTAANDILLSYSKFSDVNNDMERMISCPPQEIDPNDFKDDDAPLSPHECDIKCRLDTSSAYFIYTLRSPFPHSPVHWLALYPKLWKIQDQYRIRAANEDPEHFQYKGGSTSLYKNCTYAQLTWLGMMYHVMKIQGPKNQALEKQEVVRLWSEKWKVAIPERWHALARNMDYFQYRPTLRRWYVDWVEDCEPVVRFGH